jgi:hypothetical protein
MSIYNAIVNSTSNVGEGLNSYARNKYEVDQRAQQTAMAQGDRDYARSRNAMADQRYDAERIERGKKETMLEAIELVNGGADDGMILGFLNQWGRQNGLPEADPQVIAEIRTRAAAMAPRPQGFKLRQGETQYDAQGNPIAQSAPKPDRPGAPVAVIGPDGNPILVSPEQAVGMTPYEKPGAEAKPGADLTPAERKVDENFAGDYNEFVVQGGFADVDKQLQQLREVLEYLEDPSTVAASGPIPSLMPKFVRDRVTPRGAAAQEMVEEVVQRNLRLILGAQFTEKEGERLISRAYNPRLSEEENATRVSRLMTQIESAAQAKKAAADYYEANGTLKGFKGRINYSADDFLNERKIGGATVVWD